MIPCFLYKNKQEISHFEQNAVFFYEIVSLFEMYAAETAIFS